MNRLLRKAACSLLVLSSCMTVYGAEVNAKTAIVSSNSYLDEYSKDLEIISDIAYKVDIAKYTQDIFRGDTKELIKSIEKHESLYSNYSDTEEITEFRNNVKIVLDQCKTAIDLLNQRNIQEASLYADRLINNSYKLQMIIDSIVK